MSALRKYARALLPVFVIALIGLGVGAYILSNQRLRFPLIEEEPFVLKAEFSTAQGVITPAQGQTVRVSGVKVGEIAKAELDEGRALLTFNMDPEYRSLTRTDASALLRPKTGLKDMFVELDPGTERAKVAREGWTIPLSSTAPDVNLDELFAMLDVDTRDYLKLLVNGAGRGLEGRGRDLREVFRLFEPTHRDLARVSSVVSTRKGNLRRLVNSLNRLSKELGGREEELAELVESASQVFRAYASEDDNISATVQELPGTLRQTTSTLGRVERFAKVLGPSLENLRPAVRALGPSQRALRPFAREAAPILEKRVRPFVRETRPLVRDLRPAARDLATSSPDLTRSVRVLNNLFNMAAFNPGGRQGPDVEGRNEGFLFSLAWLAHQSSNLFSTADAHGPFRPSLVSGSCSTFRSLVNDQPEQEFLMNLTPLLTDPALCGGEGASPVKRGQADKKRRKRAGR